MGSTQAGFEYWDTRSCREYILIPIVLIALSSL